MSAVRRLRLVRFSHAPRTHSWYSHRLGRDMGVVVYGHWGPPMIAFPTSGGDEWEYERQGLIGAIAEPDRRRPRQGVLRQHQSRRLVRQRRRASAPPQLDAAAVRRLHPSGSRCRSCGSHCQIGDIGDVDDGRVARRLSCRQHAVQASRRGQALLRAVGRVRHEAVHGRRLRRQLLFQQPGRLRRQPDRTAGRSATWRPATFTSRPAPARGSRAARRTGCRRHPGEPRHPPSSRRLGPAWAGTTGRTGSIRCGSIWCT